MGTSKFWYYPDPPGNLLVEVDLGVTVTDVIVPNTNVRQASSTAFTGSRTIVQWGGTSETRIKLRIGGTSTTQRALRHKLVAMLNHMDRGGSVMFAVDSAKFYAGFLATVPAVGATALDVRRATSSIVAGASVVQAEVVLRSANPDCLQEMGLCTAQSAFPSDDTLTLSSAIVYDYAGIEWVLVRETGSWPALRLPESERGSNHLSSDHETAFSLDLAVEEDELNLAGLFAAQGAELAGPTKGPAVPGLIGSTLVEGESGPTLGGTFGSWGSL
jgi:hypothetical protein